MRTLSATLLEAQTAESRTPYFSIAFLSAGGIGPHYVWPNTGDHSLCQNKLLYMRIHELAYSSGTAESPSIMIFNNSDLSIPDLRGCYVDIGWGDVTSSGNESQPMPRMIVKRQINSSSPGNLTTTLYLEGWAEALDEEYARVSDDITDPSLFVLYNRNATVYGIMAALLDSSVSSYPITLDPLDPLKTYDGIIDSFYPYFKINAERNRYESKQEVIYRLLCLTKCYLKPLANDHLEVVYPQDADNTVLNICSDTTPQLFEFNERLNEVLPNGVIVFANAPDPLPLDYSWPGLVIGEAYDNDSFNRYGHSVPTIVQARYLTNETDANDRAAAILARMKTESVNQALVIPHHCGIELYDHLLVRDKRGRDTYKDTKVRVSGLTHTYSRYKNINRLSIYGGGLVNFPMFEDEKGVTDVTVDTNTTNTDTTNTTDPFSGSSVGGGISYFVGSSAGGGIPA